MTKKPYCLIGKIIKHSNGMIGFKLSFNNVVLARKYSEAFKWYIEGDGVRVTKQRGMYDTDKTS